MDCSKNEKLTLTLHREKKMTQKDLSLPMLVEIGYF